ISDFDPVTDRVPEAEMEEIDRYMLHRLQMLIDDVHKDYEQFEYSPIYHRVHNFIADDLSSFYLDFAKDILYIEEKNNHYRCKIQTGYYEILVNLVNLITQITSHKM